MPRPDGRAPDELRPISFERDFTEMADGSCLVAFGRTSRPAAILVAAGRSTFDVLRATCYVLRATPSPGDQPRDARVER